MAGMLGALLTALLCGYSDWKGRRIPNWLTGPSMALGLGWAVCQGEALFFLGGWLMGLLVALPAYHLRLMGAGDVKLLMALGIWLGPWQTLSAMLAGSLVALGWSVVLDGRRLGGKGAFLRLWSETRWVLIPGPKIFASLSSQKEEGREILTVPFGVSMAGGLLGFQVFARWTGG